MRLSSRAGIACCAALTLAACSGGGGSTQTPVATATAAPVLVPGTVARHTGSDTVAHVYANPQGTQSNYTAGYSFITTRTVEPRPPARLPRTTS